MKIIRMLFVVLYLFQLIPAFAQKQESTMEKLNATVWWNGPLPKYVSYMKFTKTKCTSATKFEGELGTKVYESYGYYLSNTVDTIFDASKVGLESDGKYIIDGFVREIVKLDSTDLWYRVIYPQITIGSGYVFKWTAISGEGIPWKDE